MQGFSRTYFNQNCTLDYPGLMDTNYGIKLWYHKNTRNEIKNNKQEIIWKEKHRISGKILLRNFSVIGLMETPIKKRTFSKIEVFSCKTKFDSWNKKRRKTSFTNK